MTNIWSNFETIEIGSVEMQTEGKVYLCVCCLVVWVQRIPHPFAKSIARMLLAIQNGKVNPDRWKDMKSDEAMESRAILWDIADDMQHDWTVLAMRMTSSQYAYGWDYLHNKTNYYIIMCPTVFTYRFVVARQIPTNILILIIILTDILFYSGPIHSTENLFFHIYEQ